MSEIVVKRLDSWDWYGRPYNNKLNEFKEKVRLLEVGESLEGIGSMNIFLYGRPTSFSGSWRGSSDIVSVKRTETQYEAITKNGDLWVVDVSREGLEDYIGVSGACNLNFARNY